MHLDGGGGDGVVVDGRGGSGSLDGGSVFVQAHSPAFPQSTLSCYQINILFDTRWPDIYGALGA